MRALPSVFIATPFSDEFQEVREVVRKTFEQSGWEVAAAEDMTARSASIASLVYEMIERSDLMVADVSNSNPNTMYELGIAHGLRKNTIVLVRTDSSEGLKFDISSYQMITYENLRELGRQLERVAMSAMPRWSGER